MSAWSACMAAMSGSSATITFPGMFADPDFGTDAVFTGNGWLVAGRLTMPEGGLGIMTAALDASGAPTGSLQTPVGVDVESPRLAADGADVRLSYTGHGVQPGQRFIHLTSAGAALGTPVALSLPAPLVYFNDSPVAAVGSDTVEPVWFFGPRSAGQTVMVR